jgi:hypothetical protein
LENGLNIIENTILTAINNENLNEVDIFKYVWSQLDTYGLGDLQIIKYIEKLNKAKLLERHKNISITELGKEVLIGRKNYLDIALYDFWIGGVHLTNETSRWRWDKNKQKLV